jgi:hypothetical protein
VSIILTDELTGCSAQGVPIDADVPAYLRQTVVNRSRSISQGAVTSHASRGAGALRHSLDPLLEETS